MDKHVKNELYELLMVVSAAQHDIFNMVLDKATPTMMKDFEARIEGLLKRVQRLVARPPAAPEENPTAALIYQFWQLAGSQKRAIYSELGLLEGKEFQLPEWARVQLAFERAAAKNKMKDLQKMVLAILSEREAESRELLTPKKVDMNMTVTGRFDAKSGPAIQNITPKTEEFARIKDAFRNGYSKKEHQYKTPAECKCDNQGCPICDGGLSVCKVCGCMEGSLPSECPGTRVSVGDDDLIYKGELDFRDGKWQNSASKYSPAARAKKGTQA